MAFFPRSLVPTDPSVSSFHPLFRLLDDFDDYSRTNSTSGHRQKGGQLKVFTPKFDVKELADSYELHGELPGIEQKDVNIEFTDENTLTIRGRTESSYTSGNPPRGFVENGEEQKAIETHKDHQPAVEDDPREPASPDAQTSEVAKQESKKSKEPQAKFWVSERSVGEFARSFSFPIRVDQDGVKASLKNGILSIVVPKAKKVESRKITIS